MNNPHTSTCPCLPCRGARADRARVTAAARKAGTPVLVDAEPTRRRLRALMDAGYTKGDLEASGVPAGTIRSLLSVKPGRRETVRTYRATADLVASLRVVDRRLGCTRRLQALRAVGIPVDVIAAEAGLSRKHVSELSLAPRTWMSPATVAAITAAYDRLWDRTDLADVRCVNGARRRGWAPPLAWDDDSIDFADATPNTGATARDDPAVVVAEFDRLVSFGESPEIAARRVGRSLRSLNDHRPQHTSNAA